MRDRKEIIQIVKDLLPLNTVHSVVYKPIDIIVALNASSDIILNEAGHLFYLDKVTYLGQNATVTGAVPLISIYDFEDTIANHASGYRVNTALTPAIARFDGICSKLYWNHNGCTLAGFTAGFFGGYYDILYS